MTRTSNDSTDLGHDDDLVAREAEPLDRPAEDNLREPVRVNRRGVERLDPALVPAPASPSAFPPAQTVVAWGKAGRDADARVLDVLDRGLLVEEPLPAHPLAAAVGHAPEDDLGHLQAGLAEVYCRRRRFASKSVRLCMWLDK